MTIVFLNVFLYVKDKNNSNFTTLKIISGVNGNESTDSIYDINEYYNDRWTRSFMNFSSSRSVKSNFVNINNIKNLKKLFTFKSKDFRSLKLQSTPIFFNDNLIFQSNDKTITSLNLESKKVNWETNIDLDGIMSRGFELIDNKYILFSVGKNLCLIDVINGYFKNFSKDKVCFVNDSAIRLAPTFFNDEIIYADYSPSIKFINIRNLTRKPKEVSLLKESDKNLYFGAWTGISIDPKRKIGYITTSNAKPIVSKRRESNDSYANSLIAFDLVKKEIIWSFQDIYDDIWDLDIGSPPVLTTIELHNKKYDVVICIGKSGNILIFERESGINIFPYQKIKTNKNFSDYSFSKVQNHFLIPEKVTKQYFLLDDVTKLGIFNNLFVKGKLLFSNFGIFQPHDLQGNNIFFGIHGGTLWPGPAIDHASSTMYFASNHIPYDAEFKKISDEEHINKNWKTFNDINGFPANHPPWGSLTSLNLVSGKINWTIPYGDYTKFKDKNYGAHNFGGPLILNSDLIFVSGTPDKKIRAFNSEGIIVWEDILPNEGSAPPMYFESNGKPYIVIPAYGNADDYGNSLVVYGF